MVLFFSCSTLGVKWFLLFLWRANQTFSEGMLLRPTSRSKSKTVHQQLHTILWCQPDAVLHDGNYLFSFLGPTKKINTFMTPNLVSGSMKCLWNHQPQKRICDSCLVREGKELLMPWTIAISVQLLPWPVSLPKCIWIWIRTPYGHGFLYLVGS